MTTTNKLEIIKELKAMTVKQEKLTRQRKRILTTQDPNNPLTVKFKTNTSDYRFKGTDEPIIFTVKIMIDYIDAEIAEIDKVTKSLIGQITQTNTGGEIYGL